MLPKRPMILNSTLHAIALSFIRNDSPNPISKLRTHPCLLLLYVPQNSSLMLDVVPLPKPFFPKSPLRPPLHSPFRDHRATLDQNPHDPHDDQHSLEQEITRVQQ